MSARNNGTTPDDGLNGEVSRLGEGARPWHPGQSDTAIPVAVDDAQRLVRGSRIHHHDVEAATGDAAPDWHHQSIELGREIGNREATFHALYRLGTTYWALGELDKSVECHEQVRAYAREIGQLQAESAALIGLAAAHSDAGRHDLALRLAAEAIEHVQRLGEPRGLVSALDVTGITRHRMGEHAAAIESHTEALHIANKISFRYGQICALTGLAAAYRSLGYPRSALNRIRQAQARLAETGLLILEAHLLTEAALVHHELGARHEALVCAERAVELANTRGQRLVHERALQARGAASGGDCGSVASRPATGTGVARV